MNEVYSVDNGYGTTYNFEIVDRIPSGYRVWNIPTKLMENKLLPLCMCYEGTFDVITCALKAIRVYDNETRDMLMHAAGLGINTNTPLAIQARMILDTYR